MSETPDSPEVTDFKAKLAKTNGDLYPLNKPTTSGERLFIAARHLINPLNTPNPDADTEFRGWQEWTFRMTGVILVDLYKEGGSKIQPLGHMDWWLQDDYANGGGNMHGAPIAKNDHERRACEQWGDFTAFRVDNDYHRQGIGSLIIATSAVVLPAIGVSKFYTGCLLAPAKKAYLRFGIKSEDFPNTEEPLDSSLPIKRLTQSLQVNRSIIEFIHT